MRQLNVQQAKTHLSRLIEDVRKGEDIVLAKAGKPLVRLVPYEAETSERIPGAWAKKGWIADDFDTEDPAIASLFAGASAKARKR